MHNTVKHAKASRVMLTLERTRSRLCSICGMMASALIRAVRLPGHLGLHSMRETRCDLRGKYTIESTPGFGTHIAVIIPLTKP